MRYISLEEEGLTNLLTHMDRLDNMKNPDNVFLQETITSISYSVERNGDHLYVTFGGGQWMSYNDTFRPIVYWILGGGVSPFKEMKVGDKTVKIKSWLYNNLTPCVELDPEIFWKEHIQGIQTSKISVVVNSQGNAYGSVFIIRLMNFITDKITYNMYNFAGISNFADEEFNRIFYGSDINILRVSHESDPYDQNDYYKKGGYLISENLIYKYKFNFKFQGFIDAPNIANGTSFFNELPYHNRGLIARAIEIHFILNEMNALNHEDDVSKYIDMLRDLGISIPETYGNETHDNPFTKCIL